MLLGNHSAHFRGIIASILGHLTAAAQAVVNGLDD